MRQPRNPLCEPIRRCLRLHPGGLSEYQLLGWLSEQQADFPPPADDPDQALFLRHFLVMNALYQLQPELADEQLMLHISPLCIICQPLAASSGQRLAEPAAEARLRDYYLDLRVLEQIDGDAVRALLGQFWQQWLAVEQGGAALTELGLTADASWDAIQARYRQRVAACHPDRGGDPRRFRAVRGAFETLRRVHRR